MDSWSYNFNFFYNLFLIQYFTKKNNFMVSRIWTFMTLVLFIFVNLVFFCPKMILCIKIEISRNDFYNSLDFHFYNIGTTSQNNIGPTSKGYTPIHLCGYKSQRQVHPIYGANSSQEQFVWRYKALSSTHFARCNE